MEKLKCDQTGRITIEKIMTGVNDNIDAIEAGEVAIASLNSKITSNTTAIASNVVRIGKLESLTSGSIDLVQMDADISRNKSDISTLDGRVTTLDTEVSNLGALVTANEASITTNAADIANNTLDIAANNAQISTNATEIVDLQMILVGGQKLITKYTLPGTTGGGTAANMTWTTREIGAEVYNDLGAVIGQKSITLDAGKYKLHASVLSDGIHQARLAYDSTYVYGTPMSVAGASDIIAILDFSIQTIISLESIIKVNTGANSLGKASPFAQESIFLTLEIEKVV